MPSRYQLAQFGSITESSYVAVFRAAVSGSALVTENSELENQQSINHVT